MHIRIGIDDTDSDNYSCTTYVATCIIENLIKKGYNVVDFPYLVRLNPNIPYKTRGNGAVSIICDGDEGVIDECIKLLGNFKFKQEEKRDKPQPVIAFFVGDKIPNKLKEFYELALVKEIKLDYALNLAKETKLLYYPLLGRMQGLIGAIAAIGADLQSEFTYELIGYRKLEDSSEKKKIDYSLVERMDRKFSKYIFGNIDYKKKRILITPRGKDPVLIGIRGYDPDKLIEAYKTLNIEKEITKWMIFKTNQGTNLHLKLAKRIRSIELYSVVNYRAKLISDPVIINGGHVILLVVLENGKPFEAVVYNESGHLNKVAKMLKKGDIIRIGGGINKYGIINVEEMEILKLAPSKEIIIPYCANCGSKMESDGDGKGIKCKSCNNKYKFKFLFLVNNVIREIPKKEIIKPDPRGRRHLTSYVEIEGSPKLAKFTNSYFYFPTENQALLSNNP